MTEDIIKLIKDDSKAFVNKVYSLPESKCRITSGLRLYQWYVYDETRDIMMLWDGRTLYVTVCHHTVGETYEDDIINIKLSSFRITKGIIVPEEAVEAVEKKSD